MSTKTAHKHKLSCCSRLLVVFDLAHTHYYVRSLSIACQIPLHCIALHYQAQHVSPHSFLPCNRQYSEIAGANTLTYLAASASAEFLADIGWARTAKTNP